MSAPSGVSGPRALGAVDRLVAAIDAVSTATGWLSGWLIVPMTLLRHHVRSHGVSYLAGQLYLEPHPKELMLRNHV